MVVYINEKVWSFSLTTFMTTTKRKIFVRNKEYTNNNFKYQREERIQINSTREMGHRVVGGVAVGTDGVFGPAFWLVVGLEPPAITGSDLGEGASVRPGKQLLGWVSWRGSCHEHFVGAWDRTISSIIRPRRRSHATKDKRNGVGVFTSFSQAS